MSTAVKSSIRQQQHPVIRQMADTIESAWHRLPLTPYTLPADLGYVESRLEGERLIIENRCYETPQFRKLHLELARIGTQLDILHCVMFPRPEYGLPIFGCDVVSGRGQISAAIVDLSPTLPDGLPPQYQLALPNLMPDYTQPRQLPEWGYIFSDYCCFVKPIGAPEEQQFLQQVAHYLELHCTSAIATAPDPQQRSQNLAGQHRYCTQQRQNDKTRRILEKAFDAAWAERYMTTVLFDLPDDA
ncbi:MAG: phycocyanobilin:ferredoxin oxidoreductase [Cyanobacteria bacterium P01_A01_bin.105]